MRRLDQPSSGSLPVIRYTIRIQQNLPCLYHSKEDPYRPRYPSEFLLRLIIRY